jgi:hypothetical protein
METTAESPAPAVGERRTLGQECQFYAKAPDRIGGFEAITIGPEEQVEVLGGRLSYIAATDAILSTVAGFMVPCRTAAGRVVLVDERLLA